MPVTALHPGQQMGLWKGLVGFLVNVHHITHIKPDDLISTNKGFKTIMGLHSLRQCTSFDFEVVLHPLNKAIA